MKKILTIFLLTISVFAMANTNNYKYVEKNNYKYIEKKLELKYGVLKDNKQNELFIHDIDVGIFNGKPYVNLEIETIIGDGGWKEFDKNYYKNIAKDMADYVRNMLNTNEAVEITVIIDNELGRDRVLANETY